MTTLDTLLSVADRAESSARKPIDWKAFRRAFIGALLTPFFFLGWIVGKTFFAVRFAYSAAQEGFVTGYRKPAARPTVDG